MDHSGNYKNLFDLSGKVCIVTGGTGYIGAELADALLAHGASVAIAYHTEEKVRREKYEGQTEFAAFFYCDLSSSESIRECYESVNRHYGRIDVLVNCGAYFKGHGEGSVIELMSDEVFNYGVDGSLGSVFRATREIIPYMKESGGSIINIASMYGVVSPDPRIYGDNPAKNPPNYGAAKAGVLQFTRHCGAHLAQYGIRANAITPGPFNSPANQTDAEFISKLTAKTMMERYGHPSEIAGACVLLASDASSFMTGSNITIDGGWTAW